jgi:hypothetical protein
LGNGNRNAPGVKELLCGRKLWKGLFSVLT